MNDTMEVQDDISIRTAIHAGDDSGALGSGGGKSGDGGGGLGSGNATGGMMGGGG